MRKKEVGSYLLTEETGYIKITHKDKAFNFRVTITEDGANQLFRNLRDQDTLNAYGAVFAAVHISTIMAFQDADFGLRLMRLIQSKNNPEISDAEDAEILKQEQALYNLEHEQDSDNTQL